MSDVVLLITDIRHPVSTGDEDGRGGGRRILWGKGQRKELRDRGILLSSVLYSADACSHELSSLSLSQPVTPLFPPFTHLKKN